MQLKVTHPTLARPTAVPLPLDVTDQSQVTAAADRIIRERGKIDIWVNNAGGESKSSLFDLTPESLYDITAVNYFGLTYGTQAAAEHMKVQGQGDIVQILSTSAFTPRENESAYCAAKAAAEM